MTPEIIQQDIPDFSAKLEPLVGRLRLLAEYLEQDGVNQYEACSRLCMESADTLAALLHDYEEAQTAIHQEYGCQGRVVVQFNAGEVSREA